MKLFYKGWVYKVTCVLRFYVACIFYIKRFRCAKPSMIGKKCGIHIAKNAKISCTGRIILDDYVTLQARKSAKITLGKHFSANRYSRIVAHELVQIGDHVTLGQMVSILDHDHHYQFEGKQMRLDGYDCAAICIGNNVWLGDKVTVLKGVKIGDNVVVGANTLVHKNVPSNCVVGGVPFRILKHLSN